MHWVGFCTLNFTVLCTATIKIYCILLFYSILILVLLSNYQRHISKTLNWIESPFLVCYILLPVSPSNYLENDVYNKENCDAAGQILVSGELDIAEEVEPQLTLWIIISVINFASSPTVLICDSPPTLWPCSTQVTNVFPWKQTCYANGWPVKWNPPLPERNQLVTCLISHWYSIVTYENQGAIKLCVSAGCHCWTWSFVLNFVSLCQTLFCLSLQFCLFLSLLWFVFYKGTARLNFMTVQTLLL